MVARHRVALALALTLTAAACKKAPPPSAVDLDAAPAPADHLAEGELPEGADKAFALSLPTAATVDARFPSAVHASARATPEALARFVRARVTGGTERPGPSSATFEGVTVPAEPGRKLTVEIRPGQRLGGPQAEIVVRDVTPPPRPEPGMSEAELRRKAGLTPDGKLLDPNNME